MLALKSFAVNFKFTLTFQENTVKKRIKALCSSFGKVKFQTVALFNSDACENLSIWKTLSFSLSLQFGFIITKDLLAPLLPLVKI